MKLHFYRCEICGKVIAILRDSGAATVCCGEAMHELIPNKTDAAFEKHVPVFRARENTLTVQVGSAPHPMTEQHLIQWIALRTAKGFRFEELRAGDFPEARFCLSAGDRAEEVYAYCNLHGLWSAVIPAEP